MDWDDVVYLILLFFSIGFGHFYRRIENIHQKQNVGTAVGLIITIFVSGFHVLHIFIFTFANIFIVLHVNKRKCHIVSFMFSFLYLIFFRTTVYFGIPYAPAHTNLIIMIFTLKLVGLAFELNTCHTRKKDCTEVNDEILAQYESTDIEVNFMDVFHYAFNYVSVLTGPYYTYRTYWDSLHLSYYKYANCEDITLQKLTCVPVYALFFLLANYTWPLSYALTDEFYLERSFLYRLWYVVPMFFVFRMRLYIGIILSECVCTMAGLGAYPDFTDVKPGNGPSFNFVQLKNIQRNVTLLQKTRYNFETIHSIRPQKTDFCTSFREAMKHWNMCIQYWLAVNVYKRFPAKQFRTLITMFVSAIWHGIYIGHYFCICGAPFYLPIDDLYCKLFLKDNAGKSKIMWEWIIWALKMMAFSYLGFAFQLLTVERVMHYYNSVYHGGAVVGIILYVFGKLVENFQKGNGSRTSVKTN